MSNLGASANLCRTSSCARVNSGSRHLQSSSPFSNNSSRCSSSLVLSPPKATCQAPILCPRPVVRRSTHPRPLHLALDLCWGASAFLRGLVHYKFRLLRFTKCRQIQLAHRRTFPSSHSFQPLPSATRAHTSRQTSTTETVRSPTAPLAAANTALTSWTRTACHLSSLTCRNCLVRPSLGLGLTETVSCIMVVAGF